MTQNAENARLIVLGAMVSDGGPVDWEDAARRSGGTEQQELVHQLRHIATIARAHRDASASSSGEPPGICTDAEAPASSWRHLVLFERIGCGAFGAVYRGWDPLLDREVAVKLLTKEGALEPASVSPLDEARHLARVRHPHVVVVYGADEDGERAGIWMEYIDGQTLAEIVAERGPMNAREAAGIGLDLCSALSAIHAAGLLHRDIKAQNVMRETGGRTVLMDFSGAHVVTAGGARTVFSGTPLYMAPELFEGRAATAASDVYSLGVLLFFLVSGRLPVEGATMEDVRTAQAKRERRRLRDVRSDIPDGLVQVIERAMAHDVATRFRTAGELQQALTGASGLHDAMAAVPAVQSPSRAHRRRRRAWLAAAAFVAAAAAVSPVVRRAPEARAPLVARFTIGPPYVSGSWPRISPDGRFVVYGAIVEGRNRFWLRPIDSLTGHALMGTTANETPFWSSDSTRLAYFEDERLKTIPIAGGEPSVIAEAPGPHGGDWLGNTILYARADGIYRVAASGGAAERITVLDTTQGDFQHGWPEILPNGRSFLYVVRSSRQERSGLYVGSLEGEPSRRILPAYSRTAYAEGHLVYVRDGTLVAQPFDPQRAEFIGEPVALAARVKYHAANDAAFDVSTSGALVYSLTPAAPSTRLMLFDRRGRELAALTDVGWFNRPRLSPDGQWIVAERIDPSTGTADLWMFGVRSRSAVRFTRHQAQDVSPVWSPDGRRIAFSSLRGNSYDVFAKEVHGVAEERPLFSAPGDKFVEHWSADGRYMTGAVLGSGLWVISPDQPEARWLIRGGERAQTWQSEFSPDGRWLAYMSAESGKPEVYVEPFPATGARWQISTRGGAEPHWLGGSRELLYLDPDQVLMSVRLADSEWKSFTMQPLFRVSVPELTGGSDYAVSPDGRSIVINTFVADPLVPPIDVVLNWTSLLTR